ncbi:MAG: hypothetical protein JNK63_11045 [Chthonomonas sp.]|nr:hypothetical protein [Chthonomonas sp.]
MIHAKGISILAATGLTVLGLGTVASATVSLVFSPPAQTVAVGDVVSIEVYAVSSSSSQPFAATDVLVSWDSSFLNPISYSNAGAGYSWGNSGFLFPTLNGSLYDGNAEWSGERQLSGPFPIATSSGLKLTTLKMTAVAPTTGTSVSMPLTLSGRSTRVFDSVLPNTNILGSVSADAIVTILLPTTHVLGTLDLQDTLFGGAFTRNISGWVKQGTTTVSSFTVSGISGSTVAFSNSIPGNFTGAATLEFDGSSFLKRRIDIVLNNGTMNVGTVNLTNGDVDNSGEVDAADIDQAIFEFGSTSDTTADADVNGEVDAADIDIVIANFGAEDDS